MKTVPARMIAALMTALVLISSVGSGMVLCLGEGGHVAIESADKADCCMHQENSHDKCGGHNAESSMATTEDHCHGCVDIPIPELNNAEAAERQRLGISLDQAFCACSGNHLTSATATLNCAASPPYSAPLPYVVDTGTITVLRI